MSPPDRRERSREAHVSVGSSLQRGEPLIEDEQTLLDPCPLEANLTRADVARIRISQDAHHLTKDVLPFTAEEQRKSAQGLFGGVAAPVPEVRTESARADLLAHVENGKDPALLI